MTTKTKARDRAKLQADLVAAETELLNQGRLKFGHFLRYVRVQDPPRMDDLTGSPSQLQRSKRGIRTFEMWPHAMEVVDALSLHRLIIWLKARQIGATTMLAAYNVFHCYNPYAEALLFSQGEDEAEDFLSKCNLIHQHLPPHLQLELVKDNMGEMLFANGSRIQAFPSTKKAGHGKTASLVTMDEADFHEYFDIGYEEVMPATGAGGQVIIVSTANEENSESGFKKLFRNAPQNGFHPLFYNWRVVPGRDDQWFADQKTKALDLARFVKQYPATKEEALAPSKELASFDTEVLEWMRQFVCRPMFSDGYINIYQKYTEQERYVAATDTSHGVGSDYSCTVVMTKGGVVVADILDRNMGPEELATHSMRLLGMYHNPWWAIEDNDQGITVVRRAEGKKYPRQYRQQMKKGGEHEGWHAGGGSGGSRDEMWGDFKPAVNSGAIRIPSEEGLKQFFDVQKVRLKGSLGRDEAISGGNDDYPTACGIAWFIRDKARSHSVAVGQPNYW
jgi:hypothetical protein